MPVEYDPDTAPIVRTTPNGAVLEYDFHTGVLRRRVWPAPPTPCWCCPARGATAAG
jgi:hypothetical protein